MATAVSIPDFEYLRTDYQPDSDYVEGELQERYVGEQGRGKVQAFLTDTSRLHPVQEALLIAGTEVRVPPADTWAELDELAVAGK